MSEVTFKIFRFNPETDTTGRYQEYKVTLDPGITLLNTLNKIKAEQDPTLAYRMSCGSAICGSCAMKVNGHALLACKTQASKLVVDGVIQVDPMGNCEVLRDLVVDLEPFWASLRKIEPWLKPDSQDGQTDERLQTPKEFHKIDYVTTCILCGACWSDCNVMEVDPNFLGPATLAKAHRFIFDTRDAKTDERLESISEAHGVWDCTHCGECSTRCPTDAKPLARIEETREKAMAHDITSNNGARHVLAFRKTVGSSGRLNENLVPVISKGLFNIAGHLENLPVGIRMFIRGKNPPIIHHSIEKLDEVKKIFSKYDEYRK